MEKRIVELRDVCLTYHEPHGETLAIHNLNVSVSAGDFVAIVGPSGCGKTTMLSLLCGLLPPSKGHVFLSGAEVNAQNADTGYMLQDDHLLDWRTIAGNVLLGLEVKGLLTKEAKARANRLLDTYGLSEFRHHYPRQLSGGMRQKVALIRTLAFDPKLLLLDEPFSALDYQTRLRLNDEMHHIIKRENKTALLVTHDIAEAISMADRVIVLTGRPASVKRDIPIILSAPPSPIARRKAPEFREYFDMIWKELSVDEKE